jgi:hypothetical protein
MKSDVYSWRVSRARKTALEDAARSEGASVAELLDRATEEWLRRRNRRAGDDEREQERLRNAAMRFVGTVRGGDPDRSRDVRMRVRAKLASRRAR